MQRVTEQVSLTDDIIDMSDVTDRIEYIGGSEDEDDREEYEALTDIIDELHGAGGGDHEWRGDWYPSHLINESYFEDYARQLADDIGNYDSNAQWPLSYIDWTAAAEALKQDYSTIEYNGTTYYWR